MVNPERDGVVSRHLYERPGENRTIMRSRRARSELYGVATPALDIHQRNQIRGMRRQSILCPDRLAAGRR